MERDESNRLLHQQTAFVFDGSHRGRPQSGSKEGLFLLKNHGGSFQTVAECTLVLLGAFIHPY